MAAVPSAVAPARVRAEDIPLARRCAAFAFLLIADFFYGWSWNTVDVLRPFIRDALALSLTQAGSLYSAQSAGALVGAVVLGQFGDRIGRRSMLFVIMLGYGLSLVAGVFVTSYVQVLAQRFTLGVFMGGIFPIVVGIYCGLFAPGIRGRLAALYNGTFNGSAVLLGVALGTVAAHDWRLLLWVGGLPPVCLAALAFFVVPNDRRTIPYGHDGADVAQSAYRLPIAELFEPQYRVRTVLLAVMVGLNFFGSQAFLGWVTTYLRDVHRLADGAIGSVVAWQFGASIAGGFFWGWCADRFGRRRNALGFWLGAVAVAVYLALPPGSHWITLAGVFYGFTVASNVTWGPWIAEMFPPHLRSTAASIFNWGRIISFFAPLITAAVAERYTLGSAMLLSTVAFAGAALIWWRLPETLAGQRASRGEP
jgi:MFS family permease